MADKFTTEAKAEIHNSVAPVFESLLKEIRELSRKKPELALSEFKVKQINRVLGDVLDVVKDEPEVKYIGLLSDELLPLNADAVLVMCQFEAALSAFAARYYRYDRGSRRWHTEEYAARQAAEADEDDEDYDDEDE